MAQRTYQEHAKRLFVKAEKEVFRDFAEAEDLIDIANTIALEHEDETLMTEVKFYNLKVQFMNDFTKDLYTEIQEVLKKSITIGLGYIQGNCYLILGQLSRYWGLYQSADAFYNKGLEIAKDHDDYKMQQTLLIEKGILETAYGAYDKAMAHFQQCLEIQEKSGEKYYLPMIYANFGNVYLLKDNIEEAKKYYNDAEEMITKHHDKNIWASIHRLKGRLFHRMGQYEKAVDALELAIECYKSIHKMCDAAFLYAEVSEIYKKSNDVSSALYNYLKGKDVVVQQEATPSCLELIAGLAELYDQLELEDEALTYFKLYEQVNKQVEEKTFYHKKRAFEIIENIV